MINLRRIAPINLRGLVPSDHLGTEPELIWVSPDDLYVDEKYQRTLSTKSITRIRKIVAEFEWAKFKAPNVVEIDEGYRVTDGQHGAIAALCHPDITRIPVLNCPDLNLTQQAAAFVSHARDRLEVTRTQIYHAGLVAADPNIVALERVLRAAGLTVRKNPPADGKYAKGETMAVATLQKLLKQRGAEDLTTLLTLLHTRAPVTAMEIQALDLLRHDPDFRDDWDPIAIAKIVVASSDYEIAEANQIALVRQRPLSRALAVVWHRRLPRKATTYQPPTLRRIGS